MRASAGDQSRRTTGHLPGTRTWLCGGLLGRYFAGLSVAIAARTSDFQFEIVARQRADIFGRHLVAAAALHGNFEGDVVAVDLTIGNLSFHRVAIAARTAERPRQFASFGLQV